MKPCRPCLSLLMTLACLGACGESSSRDSGPGDLAEVRACSDSDPTLRSEFPDEPGVESLRVEVAVVEDGLGRPAEPLLFNLPDTVAGVSIIVEAGAVPTAMLVFEDGRSIDFPDTSLAEAKTLNLPFNAASAFEGDCLAVMPFVEGGQVGDTLELHVVTRQEEAPEPLLPVNLIVVGDTDISDADLDEVVELADDIYTSNGAPSISILEIINVEGPTIVDDEGDALNDLRDTAFGDDIFALNVIFIQGFEEAGVLGFAGGVPGPAGVTTVASAVVLGVDAHLDGEGFLSIDTMASTLAHELGHQLGLFHTTEQSGTEFDPIADTPECDLTNDTNNDDEIESDECEEVDAPNLMFYESAEESQTQLSPSQVEVLLNHPLAF